MTLAEKLNTYEKNYWNFSKYRNTSPIVRYPAVMVAPMQECIIKEIINSDGSIKNIFDPFFGSGTVLYEGQKFGLDVMGFDINPLAVLITKVKLEGIPINNATDKIEALNSRITMLLGNVEPYQFQNINKWFNDDIILSLSVIRKAIMGEPDKQIRYFFWCCFAEIVKRYSNTRTSTFKLHIKKEIQIANTVDDSIDSFKQHIRQQYTKFLYHNKNKIDIRCGDSKELLSCIPSESLDLICTSPPYGDNQTTVPYGQFSILPLLWIDKKDLPIWNDNLLDTFTKIDSLSLGGKVKRDLNKFQDYSKYIKSISKDKQKKVISFFYDYEITFKLLAKALKPGKLMVLTLGNRRVDNQEVRFDLFNDMLAEKYGLKLYSKITRKIVGKRMPLRVSKVKSHGSVSSMSKEYVKVYKKER
jgi:site-specific DNA-methyltransferase (cytosine-N4-specific)